MFRKPLIDLNANQINSKHDLTLRGRLQELAAPFRAGNDEKGTQGCARGFQFEGNARR